MATNVTDTHTGAISNGAMLAPEKLWEHSSPEGTPMWQFMRNVNQKYGLNLRTYDDLHRWSVENISDFWGEVWHATGVKASKSYDQVVDENATQVTERLKSERKRVGGWGGGGDRL